MGIKLHMILQGILFLLQFVADPLVTALNLTPDWAEVVHKSLAGGMLLLAGGAHHFNTDGTPQTVAFSPAPPALK